MDLEHGKPGRVGKARSRAVVLDAGARVEFERGDARMRGGEPWS